jgi:hypothetical protein
MVALRVIAEQESAEPEVKQHQIKKDLNHLIISYLS